ncbi:MAG: hypothetical protein ACC628_08700 [Pirellulaceae bacterium]
MAVVLNVRSSSAMPPFSKQFLETYKEAKIIEAAKKAKCNVCHFGKSKKNRNDFGKSLSKFITKADYKELKGDKEALKKKIEDAFKSSLKEKSDGGKTFGELIDTGTLPGTAPESEE